MSTELQTVARAVDLLRCFADRRGSLSLAELSQSLRLPKVTTYRLAATLEAKGLLEQEARTRRYRLAYGMFELAAPFLRQDSLRSVALPHLEQVRTETQESVCLTVRVGWTQVAVESLASPHPIRYVREPGASAPLYTGAAGRAILAYLSRDDVEALVKETGLRPLTRFSITDPDALRLELAHVREAGYAISRGERTEGSVAVAVPLLDSGGAVYASVTVMLPDARATPTQLTGCLRSARTAAERIGLQYELRSVA